MSWVREIFNTVRSNHKEFWVKENWSSFFTGLIFFLCSLIVLRIADQYVSHLRGTPVDDIILNNLPTVDIDLFIIQGVLMFTFLLLLVFLYNPKYLNFGLKSLATFIMVRSFLISLTHLGASPHQLALDTNSIGFGLYNILYNTSNDFFFSGHTGIPILMALIFWEEKIWRYIFLLASVLFGVSVLLAHMHYSIDVFAAPFITYSIFAFARYAFPKDYKWARSN